MAINIGSSVLKDCQIGSTKVKAIYVGSTKVWPVFRLGTWTNMGSFTSSTRENFGYGSGDSNTCYLFGGTSGYSASGVASVICRYYSNSNTFSTISTSLNGRQVQACAMVKNTLAEGTSASFLIFGGMPNTSATLTDVVNWVTRLLVSGPNVSASTTMPQAKQVMGAASIYTGSAIHTFGGYYTSFLSEHRKLNQSSNTWTSLTSLPQAMNALSCVTDETGGGIYIVGGQTSSGAQDYFKYWNEATQTYTTLPSMPDRRKQHRAVYDPDNRRIYVVGGENATATATNTIFEYHIDEAKWYTNTPLPTTVSIHGLHRDASGNIYSIFGRNSSRGAVTNIYKYIP